MEGKVPGYCAGVIYMMIVKCLLFSRVIQHRDLEGRENCHASFWKLEPSGDRGSDMTPQQIAWKTRGGILRPSGHMAESLGSEAAVLIRPFTAY